jgi:hypothetical protein
MTVTDILTIEADLQGHGEPETLWKCLVTVEFEAQDDGW